MVCNGFITNSEEAHLWDRITTTLMFLVYVLCINICIVEHGIHAGIRKHHYVISECVKIIVKSTL